MRDDEETRRFHTFDRAQWADLRDSVPLDLSEEDLDAIRGIDEAIDLHEVEQVFLPLSRLLALHVDAARALSVVKDEFLRTPPGPVPYLIGVAGSVAAGKSTVARLLQHLVAGWPGAPRVDLVPTDGFLLRNAALEQRGLTLRKGYPESYRLGALVRFLDAVRSGRPAEAPVYSHLTYDVVDEVVVVDQPDVLIIEGLNILQGREHSDATFVSDFLDFTIYVDAPEPLLEQWYVERFLRLRASVFRDPDSYFRRFAGVSDGEARALASGFWAEINLPNLRENIAPTRARADLVLTKGSGHAVTEVSLRR